MHARIIATSLLLALSSQAQASIDIQFDFSYDASNFFGNTGSVATLEAVASVFETRFTDSLSAITSSGGNSYDPLFFNPADPFGTNITLNSASFATDVVRIYVGGADLGTATLGLGGPGGYGCSGFGSFCADAKSRGQGTVSGSAATDFALWGGAISFNSTEAWHFGTTTSGLDSNEADFYSVALHEMAHVLGFGIADSFNALVSGGQFVGASAGTVALSSDEGHWAEGTTSLVNGVSQEAAMDPSIFFGERKIFTDLDFAAMRDIGWEVTPVPEADTWAMMLAGLGLVGFAARRRA
jgi:hypothetical protein